MQSMNTPKFDDHAYALMQAALAHIPEARWTEAADELEQAAALHEQGGREYDRARCLQLAATMRRSAGDLDRAEMLIAKAQAIGSENQPLSVSIAAERAETDFAQARYRDAVESWTTAIERGRDARLTPASLSALFRRRALAFLELTEFELADRDFDEACRLLKSGGDVDAASLARLEQVYLLWRQGEIERATRVLDEFQKQVGGPLNAHVRSEWQLQRSRLARSEGQMDRALEFAREARTSALEAVAPVSYFSASVELGEALQASGDLAAAYEAMATAWATLSDVLGKETASSWIEPALMGFSMRWGDEAFQKAKAEYETRRRAELQSE
jgi:tetratricopeptide (TPR) repeat protein